MKDFKDRFVHACNKSPNVPRYGQGRQVRIAEHLGISQEGVRKWFLGASKPRPNVMKALAAFLDVPYVWLSLGTDQAEIAVFREMSLKQDASLYAFVSYILGSGGSIAFNKGSNDTSDVTVIKDNKVSKIAIFSPSLIRDDGMMEFQFTRQSDAVISVCACRRDGFDIAYNFVEVPEEVVAHHAQEGTPYVVKS